MIEKYLAPFSAQNDIIGTLQRNCKEFTNGAADFAAALDVQLAVPVKKEGPPNLGVFTKSGLYAGMLTYSRDYSRRNTSDHFFNFHAPALIQKEKSSARTGRNSRDSAKMSTLIRTLAKENETPTDEKLINYMKRGLRYAFIAIRQNYSQARIDLSDSVVLSLVEDYLGTNPLAVTQYKDLITEKYDKFLEKREKENNTEMEFKRYAAGCTFIRIERNDYHPSAYIVGEASLVGTDVSPTVHGEVKRYESLQDTEHAALAAMVRTYAMGKTWHSDDNEFGVERTDLFVPDLDISIGYDAGERSSFVIIPKAPSANPA